MTDLPPPPDPDDDIAGDMTGYDPSNRYGPSDPLGAHIIKVKPPTNFLELAEAKKVYEKEKIDVSNGAARIRHVVQSCFNGRRIVVFSGGAAKGEEGIFEEARAIRDGGGNGSIIGRNTFQRPRADALKLLDNLIKIYQSKD